MENGNSSNQAQIAKDTTSYFQILQEQENIHEVVGPYISLINAIQILSSKPYFFQTPNQSSPINVQRCLEIQI